MVENELNLEQFGENGSSVPVIMPPGQPVNHVPAVEAARPRLQLPHTSLQFTKH